MPPAPTTSVPPTTTTTLPPVGATLTGNGSGFVPPPVTAGGTAGMPPRETTVTGASSTTAEETADLTGETTTVPAPPATAPFGTDCTTLIPKGDVGTCVLAAGTGGTIAAVAEHPEVPTAKNDAARPGPGAGMPVGTLAPGPTMAPTTAADGTPTSAAPAKTTGCISTDAAGEPTTLPPGTTASSSSSTMSPSSTTVAGSTGASSTVTIGARATVQQTDLVYKKVDDEHWKLVLERKLTEPAEASTQLYCSELLGADDPVAVFVVPAAGGHYGNQLDLITDTGKVTLTYKLAGGFAVAHSPGSPAKLDLYLPKAGGRLFVRLSLESTAGTGGVPEWKVTSNTEEIPVAVAKRLTRDLLWVEPRSSLAPSAIPAPGTTSVSGTTSTPTS